MIALLAALLLAADEGTLSVRLVELKNDDGKVLCTLYTSEKGFPSVSADAAQTTSCTAKSKAATCAFDAVPAGTYAVACIHDENSNGKLDTGLFGIPKEGVAVSNNAKGFMGPPKYEDAKFTYSGAATTLPLKMKYL